MKERQKWLQIIIDEKGIIERSINSYKQLYDKSLRENGKKKTKPMS